MSLTPDLSADDVIALLELEPHREGGYFRRTYEGEDRDGRPSSTAVYYLLPAGELSHWHRIDAPEIWHYYAGGPLALTISENGHDATALRLGPNLTGVERPQAVVPANAWQTAESLGRWTLVGCTVSPGFLWETFELAPPDWRPTPR